jgi:vancomycin resistance protein VanJ
LRELLDTTGADGPPLQEWGSELAELGPAWHAHRISELCVASRYPIRSVDVFDATELRRAGGHGGAVRYVLEAPGGAMTLLNVHLQTARWGLTEVIDRGMAGRDAMTANTVVRDQDSRAVRRWLDSFGPADDTIVAGDFNLPVESAVYRRHWRAFGNAFSEAGSGLGWSKRTRWHGTRIDHVLHGAGFASAYARLGADVGSDHRPVIAVFQRRRRGGSSR